MKVLIFGAGVIGSLYASLLSANRCDVSILARGHRLVPCLQVCVQVVPRMNVSPSCCWLWEVRCVACLQD